MHKIFFEVNGPTLEGLVLYTILQTSFELIFLFSFKKAVIYFFPFVNLRVGLFEWSFLGYIKMHY